MQEELQWKVNEISFKDGWNAECWSSCTSANETMHII